MSAHLPGGGEPFFLSNLCGLRTTYTERLATLVTRPTLEFRTVTYWPLELPETSTEKVLDASTEDYRLGVLGSGKLPSKRQPR